MLDVVDGLDDGFQRLGDELDRILGLEAIGANNDVYHRHGDLRLLLAGERHQCHKAECEGREQEKGCEGRRYESFRQPSGNAQVLNFHGSTTSSPALIPVRISVMATPSRVTGLAVTTARSMVVSPLFTVT